MTVITETAAIAPATVRAVDIAAATTVTAAGTIRAAADRTPAAAPTMGVTIAAERR